MQSNLVTSKCSLGTVAVQMIVAMIALSSLPSFAVRGHSPQALQQVKLSVEDGRPVAKMIKLLQEKHGWVITYEDPRYIHESDIADVTLQVRRDLDKYKPGEAPKVLVPKGGVLELTYDVASNTNLPTDPAMVVQKLLDAQTANSNGGRFRLEKSGEIMHVIPTAIKNSQGRVVPQESVLDTIISLPPGQRTVLQKLESICIAVSKATGIRIELGTIPDNWFNRHQDNRGVMGQKARDALIATFASMDYGTNLSWRLLYGPGTKYYALNIHLVAQRDR